MNDASSICANGKMKSSESGASSRCQALGRRRLRRRGAPRSRAVVAARGRASEDIEPPPARVDDLDQHESHDADEEHARHGGAETLRPLHESELVAVDD